MAYKITAVFRKDDDNPWPWDPVISQRFPEVADVIENWASLHPVYSYLLDPAALAKNNPREFRVSKEYEDAESANRQLIAIMVMPEEEKVYQAWMAKWMADNREALGYVNWRSEMITEEV